jgi:hypothetical protein
MYTKPIKILEGLKAGYQQFRDPEHPLSYSSDGSVYLHRHIASLKIGRWLKSNEHVHHIDGNKLNNDPDNLQVLTNKEHGLLHNLSNTSTISCTVCKTLFKQINKTVKYCSTKCFHESTVKNNEITKELLDSLIPYNSWVSLGKKFNYSDVGIKKRAKALGCDLSKINSYKYKI